jgi:hypothetical protein
MPLLPGKSKETQDKNYREMWNSYKRTGKIHGITPRSDKHALEIITAAVKKKAGVSRYKRKKTKENLRAGL